MGNVFVWGMMILLIPVGGPLPLILYWAYLKFGKNENFQIDEEYSSVNSRVNYAFNKAMLLNAVADSKYKNSVSEEIINGKDYICLKFSLENHKDVAIEAIFFDNFKGVVMNVVSDIRPEFDDAVRSICDSVNKKILSDELFNSTCKYSYEFGYNNGTIFGHFPAKSEELSQKETLDFDEALKGVDRLAYYTDTVLIPMFLKKFVH